MRPTSMMPVRRSWSVVLACACAVAGLAGCSSSVGHFCACPALAPPAHALDVSTAGRVRWQVPLARVWGVPASPSPVAVGMVAVFAQDDVISGGVLSQGGLLYGLRLADGHRLWSKATSQPVAGMWRWQNLVIVLTKPADSSKVPPVLTGLDASTGQARWTLRMGGGADGFSPTADGGLAIAASRADGAELEVVDLSSGRVRWRRPVTPGLPPVALASGAVVYAANSWQASDGSQLTSYDDKTGQVRWTEALKASIQPPMQVFAGLVYLRVELPEAQPTSTATWPDGAFFVLLAISAADGHVKWRFTPGRLESLEVSGPGLLSAGASEYELDSATGRVRWHVASPYQARATPAGIVVIAPGPEPIYKISMRNALTGQTRWTAELNYFPADAPTDPPPAPPVFTAGPFLLGPGANPEGSETLDAFRMANGHRAWQLPIGVVSTPPSAAPGGMLVYAGA